MHEIDKYIRSIPDFPEKGIIFRDVTTVVNDPEGLRISVDEMTKLLDGMDVDVIAGIESRGFVFGMPIAYKLGKPFAMIRKKGKLPAETVSVEYALEYGSATIEIHKDAIKPGQKVVLVDDLLATGGTFKAAASLVEQLGGEVVKMIVLIELKGLNGRKNLADYELGSVIAYEGN